MKQHPINHTIIQWLDYTYSFEVSDHGSEVPFFKSHTHGYPIYRTVEDVERAIVAYETGRARIRGCAADKLAKSVIVAVRPVSDRIFDQRMAEKVDEALKRGTSTIKSGSESLGLGYSR